MQDPIKWIKKRYDLKNNLVSHTPEFKRKQDTEYKPLKEFDFNQMIIDMSKSGIDISDKVLQQIICSREFPSYDPFLDYFMSLPVWKEGDPDYITMFADKVPTTDQDYWHWCFRKFMVAVVACAINDQNVNHEALILYSKEGGNGKTTLVESLLPKPLIEYYGEGRISDKNKDEKAKIVYSLIFNLDELCSIHDKKESRAVKQLITSRGDSFRDVYGKFPYFHNRRASFVGTTNNKDILTEETGTRRYLIHEVGQIDNDLDVDINMVYAQAYALYKAGFQWYIDKTEQPIVERHNIQFTYESVEEQAIRLYFEPCNDTDKGAIRYKSSEVKKILEDMTNKAMSDVRIGNAFSALDFNSIDSGGSHYWIVRPRTDINLPLN